MTVLHGMTSLQFCQSQDSPDSLRLQTAIPLKRFVRHGASRETVRSLERKLPMLPGSPTYLINPTREDTFWAINYLRDNIQLVRELLRTEAASGMLQRYRHNIPGGDIRSLDHNQMMSLLRSLRDHEMDDQELSSIQQWHRLLTGKRKLPFLDRETVLGQVQALHQERLLEKEGDNWYPSGGDDRWTLAWRQHKLLVDRQSLSVFEVNEKSAQAHQIESLDHLYDWLQEKMCSISVDETDGSGRWPEPVFNIVAAEEKISVPELGGLGDLHQWEALIGGTDPVAAEDIEQAALTALQQQPPAAWMPGMSAAMITTSTEKTEAPPELAHSVQLHNLGSMLHLGCPAQNSRLTRQAETLRLFHPVNPFGSGPLGMSDS